MIYKKKVKRMSGETRKRVKNFNHEIYKKYMDENDNKDKIERDLYLMAKHDSMTTELSKRMLIK